MNLTTANVTAVIEALKAAEKDALQDAKKMRTTADEDMFVAMSLRRIAGMQASYRKERLELLKQTSTLGKLEGIDTFEAWLNEHPQIILGDFDLTQCRMFLQIPPESTAASRIIAERWKDILPNVVKRLNKHPATDELPKIKLRTTEPDEHFGFWIEFASSK
jgi:hypothetical protein